MDILLEILINDIFPIFLVAGLGWLLAWRLRTDAKLFSQVAVHALLPGLIFQTFITTQVNLIETGRMVLFCLLVVTASGVIAHLIAQGLHLDRASTIGVMVVVMFTNVGNFGLPLAAFAFGDAALAHATVYFVVMNILLYTAGVALFSGGRLKWSQALTELLHQPILYSIFLAGLVRLLNIQLPSPVLRSVDLLAKAAIPAMLLVLGMRLYQSRIEWKPVLWLAVLLRLVIVPVVVIPLGYALQLSGPAMQAGMLQAATPVGVSTTLLATEYEVKPDFVNSAVFLSTLLCALTLTPLIMVFRQLR